MPNVKRRVPSFEKLAIRLVNRVGVRHVSTRLRRLQGETCIELDMIFKGKHLRFSTWHVRFKRCTLLGIDEVATEVGVAQGYGNRVAVVAGTGRVSSEARRYAAFMNATTPFNVVVLGGLDLTKALLKPHSLLNIIKREAPLALLSKELAGNLKP